MKKIFLSFAIISLLVLSTWVSAETTKYIEIDGTKYYSDGTVEGEAISGVNYSADTKFLTIDNCDVGYIYFNALPMHTVQVVGECSVGEIKITDAYITLTGDGELNVNNPSTTAYISLLNAGDLDININVNFEGANSSDNTYGIYADEDCTVGIANANISLLDMDTFISCEKVSILDSNIEFEELDTFISSDDLTISNAEIAGRAVNKLIDVTNVDINESQIELDTIGSVMVSAKKNITFIDTEISIGTYDGAILTANGAITLSNTDLESSNFQTTMLSAGTGLTIEGSTIELEGTINNGNVIESNDDIILSDSRIVINCEANSNEEANGIYSKSELAIEDSRLSIETNAGAAVNSGSFITTGSSVNLTGYLYGIKTGEVIIDDSDIEIDCGKEASVGIMCSKFLIASGELNINNVLTGIQATDTVTFNGGTTNIDSDMAAVITLLKKNTSKITIADELITFPSAGVYVGSYSNKKGYVCTLGFAKPSYNVTTMKVTNAIKSVSIVEGIKYEVTSGANQTYVKNKDEQLPFTIDAPFSKFESIYINDIKVPVTAYTAVEGSAMVEISKEYVTALANKTYHITFVYSDGMAATKFTVTDALKDNTPATGTANYVVIAGLISVITIAGIVLITKKQEN